MTAYVIIYGQWKLRLEIFKIDKLIPIDRALKLDHFLQKNLILIANQSQDTRVQIFRKSGGNVAKLFLPNFLWSFIK